MEVSAIDNGYASDRAPSSSQPRGVSRACDACRTRKVRCNRERPCSHCVQAKIKCTNQARPIEKKTRILLTTQYEQKIDTLERRLDVAIGLLEDLARKSTSSGNVDAAAHRAEQPAPASAGAGRQRDIDCETLVEGDTSIAAHSVFANDLLKNFVENGSSLGPSEDMRQTLDALSSIVTTLKRPTAASEMAWPQAPTVKRSRPRHCDLPPIEKTMGLLMSTKGKSKNLEMSFWAYDFYTLKRFSLLCHQVYFDESQSEFDFITAMCGLLFLFKVYSQDVSGKEREEQLSYAKLCRTNLETALSKLPLHLPARPDVIVAVLLGSYHAVEISKPSLAWTLSSKAIELCQVLGYHNASSMEGDTPEDIEYKKVLFWSAYLLDKGFSLRLGRPSKIPDWSITVSEPSTLDPQTEPVFSYFRLWVRFARCHGNIYELLYSPEACSQAAHVMQTRVQSLAAELNQLGDAIRLTNEQWSKQADTFAGSEALDFCALWDDVLRLSLITLVYRAEPRSPDSATTFSSSCVQAARNTLERHHACMAAMGVKADFYFPLYLYWTILFSPFIPFIILFCQVIETRNQSDLVLMQGFVTSIQKAPAVSEGASKIHHLFQTLYNVACHYIDLSQSQVQLNNVHANVQMNAHLTALGFMPRDADQDPNTLLDPILGCPQALPGQLTQNAFMSPGSAQGTAGPTSTLWMLDDWYSSNPALMSMVYGTDLTLEDVQP